MVNVRVRMMLVIVAVFGAADAAAAVVARVDRGDIELNESFTLEVTTDTNIDLQPDVSVLDADFYVGQSSQLTNTTIVNGQIERSKTWTFVLMPRRAGEIAIPAITVGSEQSNPLTITVNEPSYAPPGEAEVFVTSEVDLDEAYVQAQVLLTIKIYRSVATRQPALREPTISGVEHLRELSGDDRSYDAVINGTAYNVVERVYAIYPQESGELQISPARFEARVLRAGRITGRKVFESEPLSVTVLPIPAPPAEYPDADWLPARELQLSEEWSRDPDEIRAGEPVTRRVIISALGQLETQIPAPSLPATTGINVYPDKPELNRRVEPQGIRGIREDQYAMIGTAAGNFILPPVEVPWWNIDAGEWQVARLPERTISILPSAEAPTPPPTPEPSADTAVANEPGSPAIPADDGFWRQASELLAVVWLVTLLGWWWSSRPKRSPREPQPAPTHRQQAKFLKEARRAALAGDAAGARAALLDWASLEWRDGPPRSIGALAARVSTPLAEELQRLSSASYGPGNGDWDGKALAGAIRSFSVIRDDTDKQSDVLPPLMPQA